MNTQRALSTRRSNYIKTSTLILLAFATAFFPRILVSIGIPRFINFSHFLFVPLTCIFALFQSKTKDPKQIAIAWNIIFGLMALFIVMTASTLFNNAGIINLLLDFFLKAEPFILLLMIVSIPLSIGSYEKIRSWLMRFCFIHLILIYGQFFLFVILGRHPKPGNPDYIQGVFYHSGSGHVVGASIGLTFGLYYLLNAKKSPKWLRIGVFLAAFLGMLLSDAKQVLLTFIFAGVILLITKAKNIRKLFEYILFGSVASAILIWCIQNVPIFGAFNTWIRPEIYGPEGEATLLKSASFRIIPTFYNSFLHPLIGLGPGHSVGRLGGWMLREYQDLLSPLGATQHPSSSAVWSAVGLSWLGDQSSMFSPLFGWAGIWGDIGFLGLGAYLILCYLVWRFLCIDDFSRFCLLTVLAHGLIFSQMEEPGFMLFIAMVVGLQWQEKQIKDNTQLVQQYRL